MGPNTIKKPGFVDSGLVMHQYQCNGVLAGIAICRAGFPNKIMYPEFKARYNILGAAAVAKAKNDKAAAGAVMDIVKLDKEKFRLGHAKAYQRAERKAKELNFAQGEDKKNQDRMSELASKLQMKIKTYKQQIEEAEEIAALNLAKFRKAQQELEETEERAKLAKKQ